MGTGAASVSAINNSGTAVGFYTDAGGYQDPASFNGTRTQLGIQGNAVGINDSGVIIGYSTSGSSSTVTEWSGGVATSLGITGYGTAMNNGGEIAGAQQVSATQLHAFTEQNGAVKDLGTLGGSWSSASALNNAGTVAGTSTLSNGRFAAFVYNTYGMQNLGTLGGYNSYGAAISQSGWVVGASQNAAGYLNAFLWSGGVMQNLGTLGGSTSSAAGVNSSGWVVGSSTTTGNLSTDGFLWIAGNAGNGSMFDLNSLLPLGTGWTITGAYAVNDNDDILATATQNGVSYAVELTPDALSDAVEFANVPEPAALALTAAGLIVVSCIHRKRKRRAAN